jgi:hypothetical protein
MVKAAFLSITLFLVVTGCSVKSLVMTPENSQWLARVKSYPTEFELSADSARTAWGRAQAFVAQYSSMKIQLVSECVIDTYNPDLSSSECVRYYSINSPVRYGYLITKVDLGDRFRFKVTCTNNNPFAFDIDSNAKIAAYFMMTGRLEHPDLVAR